ncbi:MAG TPA: hypothetical protein VH394_12500 [Thermoanaerobaculia bacterium]|jgi:hypothetical protein|nr:hypothetical protein [Thermoanaerobaculia bacterium]
MDKLAKRACDSSYSFDLNVRGWIPPELSGSLVVAASRRDKQRAKFSRWHDAQADLIRLDLFPGRSGRIRAHVLAVDSRRLPTALSQKAPGEGGPAARIGNETQPNHGVNIAGNSLWATNLLFGAPVELDLANWQPRRVLCYLEPNSIAPRVSTTSHFAWSRDGRYAYFHQSLLEAERNGDPVLAADLHLIELDTATGSERLWRLEPPADDADLAAANFHSAFYFEERGRKYVGLLKTGAIIENLKSHQEPPEHAVTCSPVSTIWIVEIDHAKATLVAETLPGIRDLNGIALSHLDIDNSEGDGFVLYANYKEADVAEETHGLNVYDEAPSEVSEHYSGMIVEALNYGKVLRYARRSNGYELKTFCRPYDPGHTSLGHSWLPINISLDASRTHLYCTFSGFRPRLLSKHIAAAYPHRSVDPQRIRFVPSLLMRFRADTLEPACGSGRDYISYTEPMALAVVGDAATGYVCTFSPEIGLRIYRGSDLADMICHATSASLWHWEDSHFRPEPAHMVFAPR